MLHVKICGITSVGDALMVAGAGADAVGLNFYGRSPRCVSIDVARQIVAALPKHVIRVGLFVDAVAADVCQFFDDLGLDLIQLHGNEPPAYLAQLGSRPVMRAFRLGSGGLAPVVEYLAQCNALHAPVKWALLDAHVSGQYGGTGQTTDWAVAACYAKKSGVPPLVLAGGLTPANVAEAIRTVRPAAVDTASGVESSLGQKDPALVDAFVTAARAVLGAERAPAGSPPLPLGEG
jgi:phosphoribosylanthranilate isomerase